MGSHRVGKTRLIQRAMRDAVVERPASEPCLFDAYHTVRATISGNMHVEVTGRSALRHPLTVRCQLMDTPSAGPNPPETHPAQVRIHLRGRAQVIDTGSLGISVVVTACRMIPGNSSVRGSLKTSLLCMCTAARQGFWLPRVWGCLSSWNKE